MLSRDGVVVLTELRVPDDNRTASLTAVKHGRAATVFGHV
jgi:hypothetical protein